MTIPDISVRRPTLTFMFLLGIVLAGCVAFMQLPVEMMPNIAFGDITINIDVRGGMPASEVEKRITKLVEEAVGGATHLKNLISISKEGNSTVILEFEPGINMDFAALEVREKFNRIRNRLPQEIEKPVVAKYEYMDVPIMILAVTSRVNRSPEQLRKIVDETVKDRIQRVEGVANAEVAGGREGKIIIDVDQRKLQAYGLPINRLVDIINVNNENSMAGEVYGDRNKYLVRTIGEFKSLADIENLAVATTKEGSVIRLKDVAQVKDSYLDPVAFARLNANPVVSIYVQKESTANTVKISKHIHEEVAKLRGIVDKDIQINLTFNQAEVIQQAINQVKSSLLVGALLAVAVLLIFLRDFRLVNIIGSCIPFSLLFTLFLMWATNLSLNVISLSGLALGVGMLVDNAIVVMDNVFKKRDEIIEQRHLHFPGVEKKCAVEGADEMYLAIVTSTITSVIVFLPLVFINKEIQQLYSGIALTITFSLLASLLTALTIVPLMLSRIPVSLPDPAQPQKKPGLLKRIHRGFIRLMQNLYRGIISVIIALRYLLVILAAIAFMYALNEGKKLEKEFIGIAEQNKFTVFIEMPTGTRIDVTNKVVEKVEKILKQFPDIKTSTAKVEPWSAKIFVELVPFKKRRLSSAEVMGQLRPLTASLDPAFIYFEEQEEVGTKEIIIDIFGYDYDRLKDLAIQIAQKVQGIPKFTDTKIRMREGRPELHFNIDKRQAALFGLTVENIALALHTNTRGLVATRYRGKEEPMVRIKDSYSSAREGIATSFAGIKKTDAAPDKEAKETETIVRIEERFRNSFEALRRTSFVTPDGHPVFLTQIAEFKFEVGPSEIWRKNKSRMVQVSANTGGTALGTAADLVKQALTELQLPSLDYRWELGGNYEKMVNTQKELVVAVVGALILVYMVLASLFESMAQPFIIMATVPLAIIGAILALRYTNKPVGTGVLIGGIMLFGIVVNNAIVLVDRINFVRKNPDYLMTVRKAVIESSLHRLRPIMMTSLTTILGLIPMALDKSESSNLWAPLAITVIGGMTVSTVLTLLIIPCVYMIFVDFRLVRK